MALFKINKGLAENLAKNMPYAKEGFAYFTKDDGKFYIDIDGDGTTTKAEINVNRIPLNAAKADIATMIQATAMATDDNKVYPILAFNITDSTKNLVEAKYSQIGIKNGTLVIPSVEDKDEILISNEGLGRGIVIDNKGTNNAIEILNGKGIKVAQDPTENLELTTKQYVDNQNVVLELSITDNSIYWIDQTSYDFPLGSKAQVVYSRLNEAINKGYTPTVIIHDVNDTYTYKYSFTQNLILVALLVFTVEIPLSQDGNHMGRDFIAFQSTMSGTTLTVQRLNKPLEYIPGGGKVNQILSINNNGQATWLDIPSIGDLGGATKDHTHDDRYYTETEIDDKLKALLGANDAMIFKGIVNKNTDLPDTHETGWTYRVNKAGTYAGKVCEIGDLVICVTDGLSANDSHWTVAQTNIDGAVIGPNTSTTNAVSTFADATGKVIKNNSTVTIDDTGLFTAPYIATGTNKTHYFQSAKFRGEGNADVYYHAIDFGYSGHNQVDFHEYGGIWNFYKNTIGTAADGELVASIQPNGFHGNLNGNATTATTATKAGSADKVNNNLVIKLNSGTTEGTNQFTYNGSAVKNINITPANIGAAPNSHNHDSNYVKKTGDTMTGQLAIDKAGYGFRVNNGPTGYIELSRDNGGAQLYGLWDCIKQKWIVQSDGTTVCFDGYSIQSNGTKGIVVTNSDYGTTEIGSYLDFHQNGTQDYNGRISCLNDWNFIGKNRLYFQGTTTTTDDSPTTLFIGTKDTTTGFTDYGFIASYAAHSPQGGYGANMLVQSGGNLIIGSGESPSTCYSNKVKNQKNENLYITSDNTIYFYTNCNTWANHTEAVHIDTSGKLWGAVWNDYAECREADTIEPGKCVIEVGDDTLITSTERMMPGANITSDTFGFAIGETEQAKTPIAVSGRVLAYPYESREEFKKNIGRPVCSGPNGTVSIMTDEEYREKGYCAIGTISAIPDYEEWGTGKVKVNGRVWIKVF